MVKKKNSHWLNSFKWFTIRRPQAILQPEKLSANALLIAENIHAWKISDCVFDSYLLHFIEINRTHKKNKNIFGKATGYAEKATKWGKSSRNGTQLNPCYMREKSAIAVKMHGNSLRLCSHVFISFPYSGIAVGMIENICKKYREFAPSLNSWSNTVE